MFKFILVSVVGNYSQQTGLLLKKDIENYRNCKRKIRGMLWFQPTKAVGFTNKPK